MKDYIGLLRKRTEANTLFLSEAKIIHRDEEKCIGKLVREIRLSKELSLRALAKLMGCSGAHLRDLEVGSRHWTEETLTAWESALRNYDAS